ncbi:MAG TPA: hypothetical protein PL001_04875 [Candidatus Kryptobacter bacterium]|nr:hypothetical protein [Candidatus Kryptobacter bacterium]
MKALIATLVATCLFALLQGCVGKGTPISPLGAPHFVPQSQPDSVVETGIGQDPSTGGIFLQWYTTQGAAGYKVYRSDTTNDSGLPIDFSIVSNVISSTSLNDTSTVDVNSILTGIRYYYYIIAYAADGSVSNPSDTINYKLISAPGPQYPVANASVDASGLYFHWYDSTGGGYTVVRVRDITDIPPVSIWVTKRFQVFDSYPTRSFDFDSTATAPIVSGHSYQWRVDRFDVDGTGRPYEGARSVWSTFTVK